ncbi:MAG: oligoribonuclease [Methylococcaceae bacterium TMED69]|nr:MAG: oligoribonuclease [Methylococcaceae bacterium TMED69]|tara:strand:- start:1592 stop:2143 length:552 start_codon:yes stop_codon:yes gene_type:complete
MTRKSPDSLIWIDLEMTGLNPDQDQIIEVAVAITDHHLSEIVEGPNLVIGQPEKLMESMDSWNTKQHKKSGLYKKVVQSANSSKGVESEVLQFLEQHCLPGVSPMCGNSICQDRQFLRRWMPELHSYFHYRNLDVSSLKILASLWNPEVPKFKKKGSHRAIDDVRESIAELRYYRKMMFSKFH